LQGVYGKINGIAGQAMDSFRAGLKGRHKGKVAIAQHHGPAKDQSRPSAGAAEQCPLGFDDCAVCAVKAVLVDFQNCALKVRFFIKICQFQDVCPILHGQPVFYIGPGGNVPQPYKKRLARQFAGPVNRAGKTAAHLNNGSPAHQADHVQNTPSAHRGFNIQINHIVFFVTPLRPVPQIGIDNAIMGNGHAVGGRVRVSGRAVVQGVIACPGRVPGGPLHILPYIRVIDPYPITPRQKFNRRHSALKLIRSQGADSAQGCAGVYKIVILNKLAKLPENV
jgi:hypothetical protein